mgnify:CR=1 FL=1
MQPDISRRAGPAGRSDNVGDVLASIRRLIAQDDAGRQLPGAPTRPSAPAGGESGDGLTPGLDRRAEERHRDDRGEWGPLDHASLVAPAEDRPGTEGRGEAARLHLVEGMLTAWTGPAEFAARTGWMPAPIAGWPLPRPASRAAVLPAPAITSDAAGPAGAPVNIEEVAAREAAEADNPQTFHASEGDMAEAPLSDLDLSDPGLPGPGLPEPDLSEAEIAEAEAALARMLAPRQARSAAPSRGVPPASGDPDAMAPQPGPQDDAEREPLSLAPEMHAHANLFSTAAGQRGPALQGMIRAAVRHQLEGELGETFSRNLRLLVRQEIEAALANPCLRD